MKPITFKNFFTHYIISPNNPKLSAEDQKTAKLCSAILAVCTLGTFHLAACIYRLGRNVFKILNDDGIKEISKIQSSAESILDNVSNNSITILNHLAKKISHVEAYEIKGIPNIGNSCYLNASLQNLEQIILSYPAGKQLLHSDLSLQKGESLVELEKRLLHNFCPIDVENADADLNLHLQLKWSLLVLIQVKQFGSVAQLIQAIKAHRSLFFDQGNPTFISPRINNQQDASEYMELIIDALRLNLPISTVISRGDDIGKPRGEMVTFLDLMPLYEPEKNELFSDLLAKTFMKSEIQKLNDQQEFSQFQQIRLSGSPPPVFNVRIKRHLFAPVQTQLKITEMFSVVENGQAVLKERQVIRQLSEQFLRTKNNAKIDFDLDPCRIDLGPYCEGELKHHALYEIVGVNRHLGKADDGGHYISYIKVLDRWHLLNDDEVTPLSDQDLPPFGEAFLLTLRRVEPLEAD